ncbi:MAG: hydantoin racemase [Prevotella sp.]|nr:MAG: hydantoin racemase [Prevotella sp.]
MAFGGRNGVLVVVGCAMNRLDGALK